MADIKNFGIKGIASDVQMGKSGGRLKYDAGNNRFDLTQSDGSTLEDIRFGSVTSGSWTATSIGAQYGGTGQDFSSSTGLVSFSSGTASAGNISLSNANFIDSNSQLPVAQGGTGATDAAGARSNLGLGNVALQASNAVDIDGGAIDGTVIGANSAAAITGTTITANSGFVGNLSGVADDADGLSSAVTVALSGDATGSATFQDAGDTATISTTLASVNSNVGTFGSTSAIPVVTVNAKGLVTAVTTASIVTSLTVDGDSGSQDVDLSADDLQFLGTANEIETAVTKVGNDVKVTLGLPDDVTVGNNLTVTGSFLSDDITSSAISIAGDATITGNLTVQGTQTTVNSTTVETADAIFRTNSNGANTDAGFEANTASGVKQILYTAAGTEWDFGSENVKASTFEGDLTGNVTGDVTGTVSSLANHDTSDLTEDPSATVSSGTMYYTDARVQTKIDSYVTGGTGLTVTSGEIVLDDTAVTAKTYGSTTEIPVLTIDQQGRITAASNASISTSFTLSDGSNSQTVNGGDTLTLAGGTNITSVVGATDTATFNLDTTLTNMVAATFSGQVQAGTLTDGTASLSSGSLTGAVNVTGTGTLTGGTLTDGTLSINAGNITSGVNATFSGAVEGGSLTDGTLSISSGSITSGVAATFSGAVTGGSLTDGTATLSSGDLSGAGNITASGTVQYGALSDGSISITGFVDEDNMASDSATLVPTQQSVKAYVDSQVTAQDLDFTADNGASLSIDLDSEVLDIAGGTGITTVASGNEISVGLDNTAVTAGDYGSAGSVATFTVDAQGRLTAASNVAISITNSQVSDFNAGVDARVSGGVGLTYTNGVLDLDDTAVTAKTYGSTTEIPVITVDQQGRITAASNASISTSFTLTDGSNSQTVNGGDTLTVSGTANEVEVAVSATDTLTIGLPNDVTIGNNLTVTGSFLSDDITSASVNVNGDAIITGNLTVQGTQTTVNSTTVETADAIFRVNSNGANTDAGFEANANGVIKQILYTSVGQEWDFGSENVKASTFEGDLTGDVTGTVSSIANHDTSNLTEDPSATTTSGTMYFTDARARAAISVTDAGGDGSLAYNSSTGVITYTGPSQAEVLAHVSGGTGVSINGSGVVSIGQAVATSDDVTFNNVTASANFIGNLTGDVTGDVTGDISGATGTFTGAVSFGTLTDSGESISVTKFVDEADGIASNDNDTTIPTSAAVKDYVDNNGGDGLLLRGTFTADSSASTFDIGTVPNVSSRTYYVEKIVIKVGTAFSGGSFNHILVKENGGSGDTIVAAIDADAATAGSYIIELDGDQTLTKNASVQVQFMQVDGSTPAVTTAGSMTASVHYNFV